MNLITLLLLSVPAVLVVAGVLFRRQILASRPARVGAGLAMWPVILFCGFGFLASFEGSDATFVAFRAGYVVLAAILGLASVFLMFGRVRPFEAASTAGRQGGASQALP